MFANDLELANELDLAHELELANEQVLANESKLATELELAMSWCLQMCWIFPMSWSNPSDLGKQQCIGKLQLIGSSNTENRSSNSVTTAALTWWLTNLSREKTRLYIRHHVRVTDVYMQRIIYYHIMFYILCLRSNEYYSLPKYELTFWYKKQGRSWSIVAEM